MCVCVSQMCEYVFFFVYMSIGLGKCRSVLKQRRSHWIRKRSPRVPTIFGLGGETIERAFARAHVVEVGKNANKLRQQRVHCVTRINNSIDIGFFEKLAIVCYVAEQHCEAEQAEKWKKRTSFAQKHSSRHMCCFLKSINIKLVVDKHTQKYGATNY